jgi:hypothetical protein
MNKLQTREIAKYSIDKRCKAFFRGFRRFRPLTEVAREGLMGGYQLTARQGTRYARKVARSGKLDDIYEVLSCRCPEEAQGILIGRIEKEYGKIRDQMCSLAILRTTWGVDGRTLGYIWMIYLAEHRRLDEIKEECRMLIEIGAITSDNANESIGMILSGKAIRGKAHT